MKVQYDQAAVPVLGVVGARGGHHAGLSGSLTAGERAAVGLVLRANRAAQRRFGPDIQALTEWHERPGRPARVDCQTFTATRIWPSTLAIEHGIGARLLQFIHRELVLANQSTPRLPPVKSRRAGCGQISAREFKGHHSPTDQAESAAIYQQIGGSGRYVGRDRASGRDSEYPG